MFAAVDPRMLWRVGAWGYGVGFRVQGLGLAAYGLGFKERKKRGQCLSGTQTSKILK